MCLRNELGSVYFFPQPGFWHAYGFYIYDDKSYKTRYKKTGTNDDRREKRRNIRTRRRKLYINIMPIKNINLQFVIQFFVM